MGVTGDSTPRIVEMSSGQDLMSCISSFGSTKHGEISKRKLHKIANFYQNVLTCIVSNIVSIFFPWPSMAIHGLPCFWPCSAPFHFFSGRSRHHSQWFSRGLEGVGLLRGSVQLKDWDVLIPGEVSTG